MNFDLWHELLNTWSKSIYQKLSRKGAGKVISTGDQYRSEDDWTSADIIGKQRIRDFISKLFSIFDSYDFYGAQTGSKFEMNKCFIFLNFIFSTSGRMQLQGKIHVRSPARGRSSDT